MTLMAPPRSSSKRTPDDRISDAVVVVVAAGERRAELVVGLGDAVDVGAVLAQVLVGRGGGRQPARRSVDHVDSSVVAGAGVLSGDSDGRIGDAVVVEVAGGHRRAEVVVVLG